ncbi:MAG TPA: prolipoprotein diacylglyceryl transferase family protein, partial [Patescibacteria group bacterium]|nr:prolipoprotein diacylglyceryl transferase family protein [Patescibacteria group bacterium]
YLEWKTFALGPLTLQVWGLFAALGVVLGTLFAVRQAKRTGLDAAKIESLAFWTVLLAFAGARVFHVLLYEPAYYFAYPLEILSVWKGGFSSFGGFFGALAAVFWKGRALGLPFLKTADVLAPAAALGLGCGRIGCFLIHDHPGTLAYGAGKWLAVNYPDGARYDLGLLLGVLDFVLFGIFLALARKPRPDGFHVAWILLAYAPFRFGLDFLRTVDARYLGLTPAQYGSVLLFFAGLFVMLRRVRRPQGSVSHG